MATLRLKTLTCYETEDNWGSDSAYIRVNGVKVWGPIDINDNQGRSIDKNVSFSNKAIIELWDKDNMDPDDHLGTQVAWASDATNWPGEHDVTFNQDDCLYRLIYEVVK